MQRGPTRRAKVRTSINLVRPVLTLHPESSLLSALRQFCARYGMVDRATGVPRYNEAFRFLCVVALLRNATDRVQTTVRYALAVEKPMLVSHLGRSLVYDYATRMARKKPLGRYSRALTFSPGMWLRDQLQAMSPPYRDENGRVEDCRMVLEMMTLALHDPALPQIAAQYGARLHRIREGLERVRDQIRSVLSEALQDDRMARSA